jgi:CheY-like chemotaxis protein
MTVVLLSNDLTVVSRVDGAVRQMGQSLRGASTESQAVELCEGGDIGMLVIDLTMATVDVASLVEQLKAGKGAGTRVVAFGPHVHEQRLEAAREAGCDVVISRGQFFSQLATILNG